jgi:hypothetical protein
MRIPDSMNFNPQWRANAVYSGQIVTVYTEDTGNTFGPKDSQQRR